MEFSVLAEHRHIYYNNEGLWVIPRGLYFVIKESINITNQPPICAQCGSQAPESELYTFEGHALCLRYLEENTVLCRECGEWIWREDNAGTEDGPPLPELL